MADVHTGDIVRTFEGFTHVAGYRAGFILAVTDDDDLVVVTPSGVEQVLASGVADAAWGPNPRPPASDPVTTTSARVVVANLMLAGAPGDPIDVPAPSVDRWAFVQTDDTLPLLATLDGLTWGSTLADVLAVRPIIHFSGSCDDCFWATTWYDSGMIGQFPDDVFISDAVMNCLAAGLGRQAYCIP